MRQARPGTAWPGVAWRGEARQAWHGEAGHGSARHGTAGLARCGIAWLVEVGFGRQGPARLVTVRSVRVRHGRRGIAINF
jgi:hypothetical protein